MSGGASLVDRLSAEIERTVEVDLLHQEAINEIERLKAELETCKKGLELAQQHAVKAWNRGHAAGLRAAGDTVKQATEAVERDAWGNAQLTEALLAAEAERDAAIEARKAAQLQLADLQAEVVRLEPMRQRAADLKELRARVVEQDARRGDGLGRGSREDDLPSRREAGRLAQQRLQPDHRHALATQHRSLAARAAGRAATQSSASIEQRGNDELA